MQRCSSSWYGWKCNFLSHIDETVCACITPSTNGFLEDICFCFFADLDVIVSPPFFVLEILYERVVVSAFSKSVVDENSLEVVFLLSEYVVWFLDAILQWSNILLESCNSILYFEWIILKNSQDCSIFGAIVAKVSAVCDGIQLFVEVVFL